MHLPCEYHENANDVDDAFITIKKRWYIYLDFVSV